MRYSSTVVSVVVHDVCLCSGISLLFIHIREPYVILQFLSFFTTSSSFDDDHRSHTVVIIIIIIIVINNNRDANREQRIHAFLIKESWIIVSHDATSSLLTNERLVSFNLILLGVTYSLSSPNKEEKRLLRIETFKADVARHLLCH